MFRALPITLRKASSRESVADEFQLLNEIFTNIRMGRSFMIGA